ncbi:MAG: heme o synthase [Pelagibacteraceae bacterium]
MSSSVAKIKQIKKTNIFSLRSFFNLMKPRVMSLVLFTSMVGLLIAPVQISFISASVSLFAIALGAGAAGALNMWYESDLDALMSRTCLRPIPTGKVKKDQALWFGLFLSLVSIVILYNSSNALSALLLAITIGFYFFIYTIWLKPRTSQNIVIGGAAGALPPVIGWTVATNAISIEPLILFLIIFIWTPSHFWALSLYKSGDYKKAKIPMLPVTDGVEKTKINILVYSLLLLPSVVSLYFFENYSVQFLFVSTALTFYYIYLSYKLLRSLNNKTSNIIARKIFVYSIFYLFIIFVLILGDSFWRI